MNCGERNIISGTCVLSVTFLLLNVVVLFSVVGGALLDRPCMVCQRVWACDPSVRLDAPSIRLFVFLYIISAVYILTISSDSLCPRRIYQ